MITVLGSAGVGKSRLAEEFVELAAGRAEVLRGRCIPYGEGITYWPVAEVMRQAAGIEEGDWADHLREWIENVVETDEHGRLVAERIAQLVGVAGAEAIAQETFWAVRRFIEALARRGPLLIVIDDLQWAEPTLLDLLEYLAHRLTDTPLLTLGLARPELMESRRGWGDDEKGSTIHLGPLVDTESREFLSNLLGGAIASDISRELVRVAGGNPLFLEESVSVLVEEGLLRPRDGMWISATDVMDLPLAASVHAVLAARLDGLPSAERVVVARASVIGEVFYWSAVTALCPDKVRSDVGGHLQSLVRKQLLRPAESDLAREDAFRFRHILIRDVAYQTIPKATRSDLHERFAGWLEGAAGDRLGGFEEIVAFHLEQAYRLRVELGPPDEAANELALRAADILRDTGVRAHERGDPHAATALAGRALSLLGTNDDLRLPLLMELHDPLCALADFRRADEVALEAIGLARSSRNRAAELRASLDRAELDVFLHPEKTSGTDVIRIAEKAIPVFEGLGDERNLVRA